MGIFLVLLPALLCLALVGAIYLPALARACFRNATLLDLLGDVSIQLMFGGPLVVYLLTEFGVGGGLDANPHFAVIWMTVAVLSAYKLKRAAKRVEHLQGVPNSGIN